MANVRKETLREWKKQIFVFENENNTRNVVGRRLWNSLKAGARKPRPRQSPEKIIEMHLVKYFHMERRLASDPAMDNLRKVLSFLQNNCW